MVNVHERLRLSSPMWSRYQSESSDATTTASSTQDSYASGPLASSRQIRYSWSSRESPGPGGPLLVVPNHHHHHRGRAGAGAAVSSHSTSSSATTTTSSGNERSVRSMLDGFIASTFLSCVHQPITSCVSGDATTSNKDWEYPYDGSSSSHYRRHSTRTASSRESRHATRRARSSDASHYPSRAGLSPSREDDDDDEEDSVGPQPPPPPSGCYDSSPSRRSSSSSAAAVKTPGENDVVCGKGGSRVRHSGNERFRDLCRANRPAYATLTKKQKIVMARQIVHLVRGTRPPGHFLARNPHTGLWEDVGMERSLEKAAQALRDRASSSTTTTSHSEGGEDDADERRTDEMPASPVPSVISSTVSSSVPTPRSSTGRAAPPPHPLVQIPPHLRSVFQLVNEQSSPPALHTPVLTEHAAVAHARHHHNQTQPYVSPAAYHRYPAFRGGEKAPEVPTTSMITPEGRDEQGFRIHEAMLAHAKQSWQALPLPALPDAPDDELMFSPGPVPPNYVSSRASAPTKMILDPDGGWSQHPPHHQQQQHRPRGCEPDDEFPDDEDMAAPSLVSMSTATHASSSLVSTAWAVLDRSYDGAVDIGPDDEEGRIRRPLPLFSPSGLLQSRGHRGTRPFSVDSDFTAPPYAQNHPSQPPSATGGGGGGYDSDTSMDGGTALSTALFLRLDESEE